MDNITEIEFENYKCFNNKFKLENLKSINVIIGKNNIGKSSVLDIVENIYNPEMKSKNYKMDIYVTKKIEESDRGGTVKIKIETQNTIVTNGYIFKNIIVDNTNNFNSNDIGKVYQAAEFNSNGNKVVKRIYAERNICLEDESNKNYVDGYGNGITNLINNYLNKSELDESIIKETLLNKLNEIMGEDVYFEDIQTQQVKVGENYKWEIFLKEKNKKRVALSKSGSGLKTILLVLINTIVIPNLEKREEIKDYIFLFEEIENNLHPALERRLLKYIEEVAEKGATIFLTTHSSTVIDSLQKNENAQLYHILKEDNQLKIRCLKDFYGKSMCIDDLGIKASDLLQANGIIWVEGPSDRIYINKWISLWSNNKIKEGMDYQCVFYGGRLLSNITFNENEEKEDIEDLLKLFKVNKNVIVLIDSDKTSEDKLINETKLRIKSEVESSNNFCWITKGKEIENYIPTAILEKIYGKQLEKRLEKYNNIDEFLDKNIEKGEGEKFKRNKIKFARSVIEYMNNENMKDSLDLNNNMNILIDKIKLWNKI